MLGNFFRTVRSKLPFALRFRPAIIRRFLPFIFGCVFIFCVFSIIKKIGKSIKSHYIVVDLQEINSLRLYYDEVVPEAVQFPDKLTTVVLLYQQSMKSNTWESIGTSELLRKEGYRVIIIYLPILFSDTTPWPTYPLKGAILAEALRKLNAVESVLVVPSYTGSYGLPLVVRGGYALKGFVAISPSETDMFTRKEYRILQTHTLIVYGSNDRNLGAGALENLKMIPNKEIVEVPNAGHYCHIEQMEYFHAIFLRFLNALK